jgi:hypothetical protein
LSSSYIDIHTIPLSSSQINIHTVPVSSSFPQIDIHTIPLISSCPQIDIPKPSNACFGFDSTTGWTFFDLNALHDEYRDEAGTVVEADFVSKESGFSLGSGYYVPNTLGKEQADD